MGHPLLVAALVFLALDLAVLLLALRALHRQHARVAARAYADMLLRRQKH